MLGVYRPVSHHLSTYHCTIWQNTNLYRFNLSSIFVKQYSGFGDFRSCESLQCSLLPDSTRFQSQSLLFATFMRRIEKRLSLRPSLDAFRASLKKLAKRLCTSLIYHCLYQAPHSHVPYGADGTGFYSDNTIGCYKVIQEGIPLVLQAIQSSLVKPGSVFTIVDYGTADGGTSMPLMYEAVKAIREKYGKDMQITIIYEDQPINDFKSVFMRLQGKIKIVMLFEV